MCRRAAGVAQELLHSCSVIVLWQPPARVTNFGCRSLYADGLACTQIAASDPSGAAATPTEAIRLNPDLRANSRHDPDLASPSGWRAASHPAPVSRVAHPGGGLAGLRASSAEPDDPSSSIAVRNTSIGCAGPGSHRHGRCGQRGVSSSLGPDLENPGAADDAAGGRP
jgi:hypothetical protein